MAYGLKFVPGWPAISVSYNSKVWAYDLVWLGREREGRAGKGGGLHSLPLGILKGQ
jgi:hypothetical protein